MFNNNIERRELIGTIGTTAAIGLSGCAGSSGGSGPRATTEAYLNEVFDGNYEEALSYTAGKTRESLEREAVIETGERNAQIEEFISTEEIENQAAVTYVATAETALGTTAQTRTALLVQQENEWKIVKVVDEENVPPEEASEYTD